MTATTPRPPEQILSDVDANVDYYVHLMLTDPLTTPRLMTLALDASERNPELLALLFATALQKLTAERAAHAHALADHHNHQGEKK